MFRILLPTDFSPNAVHAVDFVLNHFDKKNVELILIHTIRAPNSAAGVLIRIDDLMRKDAEVAMNQLVTYVKAKHNLIPETIIKIGNLGEWINKYASKHNINMVAMGTKGESNLESKLFGSVTESIIRTIKIPLLAVPVLSFDDELTHIAIATDKEKLKNEDFIVQFLSSLKKKQTRINAIKVLQDISELSAKSIFIDGKEINIETVNNDSVVAGINYYIDTVPTDLLIIYHSRNSKIDYFFNRSITKNISAKTSVPLLVIPT